MWGKLFFDTLAAGVSEPVVSDPGLTARVRPEAAGTPRTV